MRVPFLRAVGLLPLLLLAGASQAQEKSLRWAEIAVRARLDAEGVLHGGERRFNLRLGQHLQR